MSLLIGEFCMDVQWHIAFCNMTYSEYAGMTYRQYYASPENTLEAQLIAKEVAERKFGVGCFMAPCVDLPSASFASYLGMPVIEPEGDELPYIDCQEPVVREPSEVSSVTLGDPKTTGMMARRYRAWEYYRSQGYEVRFGGHGGSVVSTAHEISVGKVFLWMLEDPKGAHRTLDLVTDASLKLRDFDDSLCGPSEGGYTGDDYSGLLSPELYRRFAIPQYERIYARRSSRFMHSELLRAEHLRMAKDLLGIPSFHGAGCKNLTLAEMHEVMGNDFWTQITPQELLELSPQALAEKVKVYAHSGCAYVQLYPGRRTPDANMEAAIAAAQRECSGGARGGMTT